MATLITRQQKGCSTFTRVTHYLCNDSQDWTQAFLFLRQQGELSHHQQRSCQLGKLSRPWFILVLQNASGWCLNDDGVHWINNNNVSKVHLLRNRTVLGARQLEQNLNDLKVMVQNHAIMQEIIFICWTTWLLERETQIGWGSRVFILLCHQSYRAPVQSLKISNKAGAAQHNGKHSRFAPSSPGSILGISDGNLFARCCWG